MNQQPLADVAENAGAGVTEAIRSLITILREFDPLEIISRVAIYCCSGCPDAPQEDRMESNESHLEYLMSLALALPYPDATQKPSPDEIQRTIDLIAAIFAKATFCQSFNRDRTKAPEGSLSDLAWQFQLNTLHVRGDAYWPHFKSMLEALLLPHDPFLLEHFGFVSEDFFALAARAESNLNENFQIERETKATPFRNLLQPWSAAIESHINKGEPLPEDLRSFIDAHSEEFARAKEGFDSVGAPSLFAIRPRNRAEESILRHVAMRFGENAAFQGTKPAHDYWPLNPSQLSEKPVIEHGGAFYPFHLPLLQRNMWAIIGNLIRRTDASYWRRRYLRGRDAYAENETVSLFRKALPGATVHPQMLYDVASPEGPRTCEVDLLVLFDDFLLIVETKAGGISPASRRGAPGSVANDLKDTIIGAQQQAARLEDALRRTRELRLRSKDGGIETTISAADVRWIIRIAVTLELLNFVTASLWHLEEAGMITDATRSWSVSLNDLRVIVEILDRPSVFLHYLLRRLTLERIRQVRATDELDYLMHYVQQGLFFEEKNAPAENQRVILSGFTAELDQYYRRVEGISPLGKKPRVRLGEPTRRMLDLLEGRRPEHYTSACIELLEIEPRDREAGLRGLHGQLRNLKDDRVPFGLTVVGNATTRKGIGYSCTRSIAMAEPLILERCRRRCPELGLDHVCLLIMEPPLGGSSMKVVFVRADVGAPSPEIRRLVDHMRFEGTVRHRTD